MCDVQVMVIIQLSKRLIYSVNINNTVYKPTYLCKPVCHCEYIGGLCATQLSTARTQSGVRTYGSQEADPSCEPDSLSGGEEIRRILRNV
jgi:hypothetical protein